MKVRISPQAETDIIRQFRYYLVDRDAPVVALRYRKAVMETVNSLPDNPKVGKLVEGRIPGLRSWPVKGFDGFVSTTGRCKVSYTLSGFFTASVT